MKLPWVKWFPTDWLSESEISKTSLQVRGLWIEALNVMFNSDTYTLSGTPEEMARVLRCSVAEFNTAFEELKRSNVSVTGVRNGVVTLMSRRLERQHKKRNNSSLRVQRYREKRSCNAISVSASASASECASKDRGSGGKGFPVTVDDALAQCALTAVPKEFIMHCFDKGTSRGGNDSRGNPIADFPAYVRMEWKWEQDRLGREKAQAESRGVKPYQGEEKIPHWITRALK